MFCHEYHLHRCQDPKRLLVDAAELWLVSGANRGGGNVLAVSLIALVVLTLIGVAFIQTTALEQNMHANLEQIGQTFQVANSAQENASD